MGFTTSFTTIEAGIRAVQAHWNLHPTVDRLCYVKVLPKSKNHVIPDVIRCTVVQYSVLWGKLGNGQVHLTTAENKSENVRLLEGSASVSTPGILEL